MSRPYVSAVRASPDFPDELGAAIIPQRHWTNSPSCKVPKKLSATALSKGARFREQAVAYVVEQSKSIAAAARELGIEESTLADSMRSADHESEGGGPVGPAERDEMRRSPIENGQLQMRVALLKNDGLLRERDTELIFRIMHAERARFPIAFMADEFGVSSQGYAK